MRRLLVLICAMVSLSSVASAYYHWTFFSQRSGPFQSIRLRFDVDALPDAAVSFFIAQQGPAKMVDGDNFPALVSQIRRAGETWNAAHSGIKVKFGGLQEKPFADVLAEQVTPGIDVVFDELPPGVLALSDPQTYTDRAYLGAANSPGFAPIVRSRLTLASDLALRGQASHSDAFFLTMVHEFGHALGLQHSMTAGVMATSVTRGTSKALPLAADDIAGLSVLYPTAKFRESTGSIEGRVNVVRNGANLASVVALGTDGTAIGAMTRPDGTYRIDGLPPDDYIVYAHPLPPAQPGEAEPAGIVPPRDLQNVPFLAGAEFQTRFYPNQKEWREAVRVNVDAGRTVPGIDFELQLLIGTGIYNLRMFGYLGAKRDTVVHAPPLVPGFTDWLAFQASGTQVSGSPAIVPGLQMSAVSDLVVLNQQSLRNFPGSDQFLLIAATAGAAPKSTPVAVAVTSGENLYVLPGAFTLVPSKHPLLTSVTPSQDEQGRWLATLTGENLQASTRVVFDGADAQSVKLKEDGSLLAVAPPASGPQRAAVALLGVDGQTSGQLLGTAPPLVFPYEAPVDPAFALTPSSVLAGTNTLIEIEGGSTAFLPGKTAVGFGTSDIVVRQMWVVGPDKLLVNVSIHPKAKLGPVTVTISTGIQLVTIGVQLQVRPPEAKQMSLLLPIVNEATGLAGAPAGGTITMRASGLPADLRGWSVTIGDTRSPITQAEDGRLIVPLSPGVPPGPQPVQLVTTTGQVIPPVFFQIDVAPPSILAVSGAQNLAANTSASVRVGDRVALEVRNLFGDQTVAAKEEVQIRIAGILQRVDVLEALATPGIYRVEFLIPSVAPVGEGRSITIGVGTRISAAFNVAIIAAP